MKPKYEWLKIRNIITDEFILDNDGEFLSWEEEIPPDWNKAFGQSMIEDLNNLLVKYNFTNEYRIVQIKEKYGELRWYDNGVPDVALEEYHSLLNKYKKLKGE